jgi:hypothetical protein
MECIAHPMQAKQALFVRTHSLLAVRDNSLSLWDTHLYLSSLILHNLLVIQSHDHRKILCDHR